MHTESEILAEIKRKIKFSWSCPPESRQRIRNWCDALLWVLYDNSHYDICPYCGEIMQCDIVDVGVGYQQCGPYHCESCGASEIHPDDHLPLDEDEKETGYYKNRISPLANTSGGKLVTHKKALELYSMGLLDNCKPYISSGD